MSDVYLSEGSLMMAVSALVRASEELTSENAGRPTSGFDSLTGIAGEVDLYLRGVSVARAALADAAKTAGRATRGLLEDASRLDATLAASLDSGFAMRAGQ